MLNQVHVEVAPPRCLRHRFDRHQNRLALIQIYVQALSWPPSPSFPDAAPVWYTVRGGFSSCLMLRSRPADGPFHSEGISCVWVDIGRVLLAGRIDDMGLDLQNQVEHTGISADSIQNRDISS